MRAGHSLRLRLFAATCLWMLLTVGLAGWGIEHLFRQHIMAQLQSELKIHLDQLTAAVQIDDSGAIALATQPSDARFSNPYSGMYWQIAVPASGQRFAQLLRSRSLWDARLPDVQDGLLAGRDLKLQIVGPAGQKLQLRLREVHPADGPFDDLILAVAADQELFAEPIERFTRMLAAALGVLLIGMLLAAWMQVQFGLRPLRVLRSRLADLRSGREQSITGRYPAEIQPLVDDFNKVLAHNSANLERARMQAGNLAHALKTPLAVMTNAAHSQDAQLPQLVLEQVASARRQVDYHLARARAAAAVKNTGMRSQVLPLLQGLVRVMERVHAARGLQYDLQNVPASLYFRGEAQDFQEMLGNVLDNAGKWARRHIVVSASAEQGWLRIFIDDDGPGIDPQRSEEVFERGRRADERTAGSGLGLGIVRDLAELYGGSVEFAASPQAGARIQIVLPEARA